MRRFLLWLFALFCVLAIVDLAAVLFSSTYRDLFGRTHDLTDAMWRIIPDVVMATVYGIVFWKLNDEFFLRKFAVWHGVVYGVLSVLMCIPWGGYFLAAFSPIGILYLTPLMLSSSGYFASMGVAVTFFILNVFLFVTGRKKISVEGSE